MRASLASIFAVLALNVAIHADDLPTRIDVPHETSVNLIREVLKDSSLVFSNGATWRMFPQGENISYQARRYRVYQMPDGSRLEMAAIENRTELSRRERFRVDILSGKRPFPIEPFPDFYFVFRRTAVDGQITRVRIDLHPKAWMGFVDEPGEIEKDKNGDWIIRVPFSVFLVEPDQTRQIQMLATYSLVQLREIAREESQEMRHLHKKQTFELYRKGKRVAGQETGKTKSLTHLVSAVIVDENQKPIPNVPVLVEWSSHIYFSLFKFKRFYHEKFVKTDDKGYFSFRSGGNWFVFKPYLKGYIPLDGQAPPDEMPLTIVMPAVPPDADRLTPQDFQEIGDAPPFSGKRGQDYSAIGFSLGTGNKPPGAPALGGWTTNREHADFWFVRSKNLVQSPYSVPGSQSNETFVRTLIELTALNGTEIQRVQYRNEWGMSELHIMREAPEWGYTNYLSGFPILNKSTLRNTTPSAFPGKIYFRKNGRYGFIRDIYFNSNYGPDDQGRYTVSMWNVYIQNLRMQSEVRTNRTLIHKYELEPYLRHPRAPQKKDPRLPRKKTP